MAVKTNANIGFEKQLWDAACVLWGHIPAAEYRKGREQIVNKTFVKMMDELGYDVEFTYKRKTEEKIAR